MMQLGFSDATYTRDAVRDRFDLLLGVQGTLLLTAFGRAIYSEPLFPIVELRTALKSWLSADAKEDFEFVSIESDEGGLVWFRRQPSGYWRVGSSLQDDIAPRELPLEAVCAASAAFADDVDRWVREHLKVEVAAIVGQ